VPVSLYKSIPTNAFAEIIAACDFEELSYETAFKALDILHIIPQSSDPMVMAAALFVATSVGETRLISLNNIFRVMAPWADANGCRKLIKKIMTTPGVVAVLSNPSTLCQAMNLVHAQTKPSRPSYYNDPVEIANRLISKYIQHNGNKLRTIDILDCI
jgi:hypothetical protein